MKYSLSQMQDYINQGRAIDARMGGLIYKEGGVYFWVKKGDYYSLEGEVEGYEYILNFGATSFFKESSKRFHQFEKHKGDFEEYIPSAHIKVLDTRHETEPKFLLLDDNTFSIINKYSTKGYLNTIDKMNKSVSYKIINENLAERIYNNVDPIEIRFYDSFEGTIEINIDKNNSNNKFMKWLSFIFPKKLK